MYKHPIMLILCIYFGVTLLFLFLLPNLTHGKTPGKAIVKIRLTRTDGTRPRWYQYLSHFFILYDLILPAPFYVFYGVLGILTWNGNIKWITAIVILILAVLYIYTMYQCILSLFDKDILPWYDRMFPVKNCSAISVEKAGDMDKSDDALQENANERITEA